MINFRQAAAIFAAVCAGCASVYAQTASPSPAPSPAPAPSVVQGAPPTGSPALSPTPATPSPGGVAQPPPIQGNSTSSQSNVDLHPPTRLNPGGASPSLPNAATTPGANNPPPYGGRPQPGGAISSQPTTPKKTGNDYSVAECLALWDAKTHMTKREWKVACERVQNRLESLERTAKETGVKKGPGRQSRAE